MSQDFDPKGSVRRIGAALLMIVVLVVIVLVVSLVTSYEQPAPSVDDVQTSVENLQEVTGELQDTVDTLRDLSTAEPEVSDQLNSIDQQLDQVDAQLENIEQEVQHTATETPPQSAEAELTDEVTASVFTVASWIIGLLSISFAIALGVILNRKWDRKKRLRLDLEHRTEPDRLYTRTPESERPPEKLR